MDFRDRFYQTYGSFKGWSDQDEDTDLFSGEFQAHGLRAPGALLEIGFGSGQLLEWAALQGFQCVGVEVSEPLVREAKARQLEVYHLPLQRLRELKSTHQRFDIVVIFDVLEHLYPDEILDLFDSLYSLLNDGGKVLCRFPNGLSPFATQTQHADFTHVTVLTTEKMRQLALATGFRVLRSGNSFRSLKIGRRSPLTKKVLYRLRDIFELALGLFYFGGRVALDPNLSLSLEKIQRPS
jgi:2-polyprenyl-3-methyl-5-hydroxy-6-metoxy-1,4-benzoquinol methylase